MKGICFIEPMQRAVVAGRKTMTRRIMSPQPLGPLSAAALRPAIRSDRRPRIGGSWWSTPAYARFIPGEVVYIKEPYIPHPLGLDKIFYKYDPVDVGDLQELGYGKYLDKPGFWRNKLFMPANAARHFIRITGIRGERLQDISDQDCLGEGVYLDAGDDGLLLHYFYDFPDNPSNGFDTPRAAFAALIDKVSGRGTWGRNPWVWVYGFEFLAGLTPVERRFYIL